MVIFTTGLVKMIINIDFEVGSFLTNVGSLMETSLQLLLSCCLCSMYLISILFELLFGEVYKTAVK